MKLKCPPGIFTPTICATISAPHVHLIEACHVQLVEHLTARFGLCLDNSLAMEEESIPRNDQLVAPDRLAFYVPPWKICINETISVSIRDTCTVCDCMVPMQDTAHHEVGKRLAICTVTGMTQACENSHGQHNFMMEGSNGFKF